MTTDNEGILLGHYGCIAPDCDSSDAMGVWEKGDKKDGYCFSCASYIDHDTIQAKVDLSSPVLSSSGGQSVPLTAQQEETIQAMRVAGWKERRISRDSYEKFGCRTEAGEDGKPAWFYYPYYNKRGVVTGYKKKAYEKTEDSKGKLVRKTFTVGSVKKGSSQLFGQHLFDSGGKILLLCEGEDESIAWWQSLHNRSGGKYSTPCVSVGFGASSAVEHIKTNYAYVTSFDKVLVAFDNDKAGKEASEAVLRILKPGQGFEVKFKGHKDACDYLAAGQESALVDLFWRADRFSPVDVVSLGDLWDDFENSIEDDIIELPPQFRTLSSMMGGGIAHGEVTVLGALTSVGKSSVINNIAYHAAVNQGKKVGLVYLESSPKELVSNFLSIHIEQNLALQSKDQMDMTKLKAEFQDLIQDDDKFVVVRHDGAFRNMEEMNEKIRWLAMGAGCDLIILDPLQAAVPDNSNEMLDKFMDSTLKITKESNCSTLIVSHMRKPDDKNAHAVDEYSLKGCVDKQTEFLTEDGWITIDKWEGQKVATVDTETEGMEFEQPLDYVELPCKSFIHYKSKRGVDMVLSDEHRVLYTHANERKWRFITAAEMLEKHEQSATGFRGRFPTSFVHEGKGMNISDEDLRLAVAFQADGCQRKDLVKNHVVFAFKKQRKVERLEKLLEDAGITQYKKYITGKGISDFRVRLKRTDKKFEGDWWDVNSHQARIILEEITHWDGCEKTYATTEKGNADYIQYLHASTGVRASIYKQTKEGRQNPVYTVTKTGNNTVCIAQKHREDKIKINRVVSEDGKKYCFTTTKGTWVARRNGKVFVTGNSSSINQIAFNTILLSRDKVNEDERIRNSTKITLVKCRRMGLTGEAGWLAYDNATTKIREQPNPYEDLDEMFGSDEGFEQLAGNTEVETEVPDNVWMSGDEEIF